MPLLSSTLVSIKLQQQKKFQRTTQVLTFQHYISPEYRHCPKWNKFGRIEKILNFNRLNNRIYRDNVVSEKTGNDTSSTIANSFDFTLHPGYFRNIFIQQETSDILFPKKKNAGIFWKRYNPSAIIPKVGMGSCKLDLEKFRCDSMLKMPYFLLLFPDCLFL